MMKVTLVALAALVCLTVGCWTVKVEVPAGSNVKLTGNFEGAGPTVEKFRIWYVLWGLVPISENSTAPKLQGKTLSEVSVQDQADVLDLVISFFLGIVSINTRTVEIRGR